MAENNHQRTLALRAPRGVLFDRDRRVLVENRDSFVISIVREHSRDLDRTIRLLAAVVGVDRGGACATTVRRHRSEPRYRPIADRRGRDAGAGGGGAPRTGSTPNCRT